MLTFCLLSLFALAGPALLLAQFQQPTQDELKMTADPKAPGAAAVYLYREETTDDTYHFHSYYARIKVLTEKGKDLATVRIPYEHGKFQVAAIQGRTIHADGTVIPLTAKPSDLLDSKTTTHQFNEMVFNLPSVEVGSILEYRLQLRYSEDTVSSPQWDIQQPYFVHKAHYLFNPVFAATNTVVDNHGQVADGLMYASRLDPGQAVVHDALNRFTLDVTDIRALPDEDWMPPLNSIKLSIKFYYTSAQSGSGYWQAEGKYWAREVDRFASPSSQLKKAVSDIVAPTDSPEQKARKIYAAVMKLKNTDFIQTGPDRGPDAEKRKANKDATSVWKQSSGSGDDLALLFVALGRAAGLKVWPMQVVNRDRATFEDTYLSTEQLDDFIAVVEIDGKDVFVDPGQSICSFGDLHWKHELASGFQLGEKGATISTTPASPPKANATQRFADLIVDTHGNVEGTAQFEFSGQEALYWRQLALQVAEGEVKKQFDEWIRAKLPAGVEADLDHFKNLDNADSHLVAIVKISGSLAAAAGKRILLPGEFFESRASHPFVAEVRRAAPVDLQYTAMVQDDVIYHLPEGLELESPLRAVNVSWPDHGSMQISANTKDGAINVARTFVRNFALLEAGDYRALRDFYQKVAAADQQQLVLTNAPVATSTPAAKGN